MKMLSSKVKLLIKSDIKIEDSLIEFSILEVKDYIMNYCNRKDVPKELDITIVKLVADIINFDNTDSEEVKSLSQGDTSITFNTTSKKREDLFKNYHKTFKKFRMVRK